MDDKKNFFPDKEQRESLAKCKTLFEIAWRCRELEDMAGYADALADIQEELNKYSPEAADCGMPLSNAQVVEGIRRSRDLYQLNLDMDCIIRQIRAMEKLLRIDFFSCLAGWKNPKS